MCLEVIEDMLAEVNDRFIVDIAGRLDCLREVLSPDYQKEIEQLHQLHLERSRTIAERSFVAGVAMGRGFAVFGPKTEPGDQIRQS